MANPLHIAHFAEIMGAALIASGLYRCAVLHTTADAWRRWLPRRPDRACGRPFLLEDVPFYADPVRTLARKAGNDLPSNLAHGRIWAMVGESKAAGTRLGTSTEPAISGPRLEMRCGALDWGARGLRGVEA